ncbi:MAG: hydrogenase maturation protease [Spirochaetes bacterium]|nr:MAG: hydrogenase maturation protease [Spirochaetota bacterium]
MSIRTLVYGYGNPGREDDGLGVELARRVEEAGIPGVACDSNYQLNVEDALEIAEYDAVVFADASVSCAEPFTFNGLEPAHEISFTTHAMLPGSVLALCEDLYGKKPSSFILGIRGYSWEQREGLSAQAVSNLEKAFDFLLPLLRESAVRALEGKSAAYAHCSD